jgi:hypothetical protein
MSSTKPGGRKVLTKMVIDPSVITQLNAENWD